MVEKTRFSLRILGLIFGFEQIFWLDKVLWLEMKEMQLAEEEEPQSDDSRA